MEEKQIEEMANIERLLRVRKLDIEKQGFDVASIFYGKESEEASVARYLVEEGYRKASDVAREILAEIIELAKHSADEAKMRADKETNVLLRAKLRGQQIGGNLMLYKLAELKKKYESEG